MLCVLCGSNAMSGISLDLRSERALPERVLVMDDDAQITYRAVGRAAGW